jgi:Plant transposon protein
MSGTMNDVTRKTLLTLVASLAQEENLLLEILLEEDELEDLQVRKKKSRHIYERPDYQKSVWWTLLQKGDCKDPFNRQCMVFRRRFRSLVILSASIFIPQGMNTFDLFKIIVERARTWSFNEGKTKLGDDCKDCIGNAGVPLELKILGALRMSAKGCSFDAIAELSGMSIATMQNFFHQFWAKFNENFREEWIVYPTTAVEAAGSLEIYRRLGFPGAVGSVDCTHVLWGRCPAQHHSAYSGKE